MKDKISFKWVIIPDHIQITSKNIIQSEQLVLVSYLSKEKRVLLFCGVGPVPGTAAAGPASAGPRGPCPYQTAAGLVPLCQRRFEEEEGGDSCCCYWIFFLLFFLKIYWNWNWNCGKREEKKRGSEGKLLAAFQKLSSLSCFPLFCGGNGNLSTTLHSLGWQVQSNPWAGLAPAQISTMLHTSRFCITSLVGGASVSSVRFC